MLNFDNYILYLHRKTSQCNAKIMKKGQKTIVNELHTTLLPLQGYMSTIVSRSERASLKLSLMVAMGICSSSTFYRMVVSRDYRPDYAKREAAAEVIRKHSGNNAYTGEDLFPEHLYN